jgi:hypothetical protein
MPIFGRPLILRFGCVFGFEDGMALLLEGRRHQAERVFVIFDQ